MHNAAPQPAYPRPRPPKRRRRTATTVLAGDFDPLPLRDFFTDMANSNDPLNPYSSVLGHGPGILFDIRSQQEKDTAVAHEQRRSFTHAKRKERDVEVHRARHEKPLKKLPKRPARTREPIQVNSAYTAEDAPASGSMPAFNPSPRGPPLPLARAAAAHPPRDVSAFLPSPHAGPSVAWTPHYTVPYSSAPLLQSVPMAPTLAISVPPPPAFMPNSPPTPSRSVSSYTSRTSSKRLRTPDDDEMLPGVARMQIDSPTAFQIYDATGNIYSHAESLGGIARDKGPAPKPPSAGASPSWLTNEPPRDIPPQSGWETPQLGPSYFDQPSAPPPSTAHRRHALSVAALLSPTMTPLAIGRPTPAPEPQPQPSAPQVESPSCPPEPIPEPPPAAAPTVGSPCLSPLPDVTSLGGDFTYEVPDPPAASADEFHMPVEEPLLEEAPAAPIVTEEAAAVLSPTPEPGYVASTEDNVDDSVSVRGDSVPPPFSRRDKGKGRASKAMRIIESEDEGDLTELDQLTALHHARKHKAEAQAPAPLPDPSHETGEPGFGLGIGMSAGPGAAAARSAKRKRPAPVRKGWKGWIEVEVDEETKAPEQDSLSAEVMLGERRTRSGRNFDA